MVRVFFAVIGDVVFDHSPFDSMAARFEPLVADLPE